MVLLKVLWWTTKFSVKHVVIPIATTAVIAAVLDRVADRVASKDQPQLGNGMAHAPSVAA